MPTLRVEDRFVLQANLYQQRPVIHVTDRSVA